MKGVFRNEWMFLAAFLLLFAISFLGGAEATVADLRNKGYDVPHLWQKLEPYQSPCSEKGDVKR